MVHIQCREVAMNTARTVATVIVMASVAVGAAAQEKADQEFQHYGSVAAYQSCDLSRVEEAYLRSLGHDNYGVVESAIGNVARLKIAQPETYSESVQDKLRDLAVEGPTPAIRYKASLASLLCDRPELFVVYKDRDFRTSEELFRAIAHRLEEATLLLVSR